MGRDSGRIMNNKAYFISKKKQCRGVSLISLMVALAVSALSILVSISAFQNLSAASVVTQERLNHDAQIAATLITAEKLVIEAGYRIPSAADADIIVDSTAATSSSSGTSSLDATTSLLWRYSDGTSFICRGLREDQTTIGSRSYRRLKSIAVSSGCNGTDALDSFTWDQDIAVLGLWAVTTDLQQHLSTNGTLISFEISTTNRGPFGFGELGRHLSAKISIPTTVELSGAVTLGQNAVHVCLTNTYPT